MMNLVKVPVDKIRLLDPAPATKRRQESLFELGQIEPIRLASINGSGEFEVMDGRRRLADLLATGATEVDALVEKDPTATRRALTGLALNLGRSDNPMNEARMIGTLLDSGMKVGEIAKSVGAKQPVVSQRIALLKLIGELQHALEAGEMPFTAARYACKWSEADQRGFYAAGDLTVKAAREFHDGWQSDGLAGIDMLPAVDNPVVPGHFLVGDDMARLAAGEPVTITWQGQTLTIVSGEAPVPAPTGPLTCNCDLANESGADAWYCPVHGQQ